MKFALSEQNLLFVIASIIASQYDFPSTTKGNATFFSIIWHTLLLSSLRLLQLEALVSWPNGFSYISSYCLLIYLVYWADHTHLLWWPQNIPSPACNSWQYSISDTIKLNQFLLKLFNLLFLFLNYPNILCINPDISQRWCNQPVCRHSWCQCWCWWRCRCCVGFTLFCMSSHHCYWTMQAQSDSLSLVDTAISDQCANGLPWFEIITCMCTWLDSIWNENMSFFQQRLLMYRWTQYAYHLGNLKARKLFAFL